MNKYLIFVFRCILINVCIMSWILKGLLFYGFTVLLFYCFMLNFKFYHNIIPSSTIFLIRITNSILFILKNVNKRIYIIQSMAGLFPLNVMNRSSLIILKLLKLSYCSQACKLSIKNNLDFKLNHYRKKKKTQRFILNKNWFDKIPSDMNLVGYYDKNSFL